MNTAEVWQIVRESQAIIENTHVVYTSGRHGDTYFNKDAIYPNTRAISRLCQMMAQSYKDEPIDTVVGPALGAIILSQWTAHYLSAVANRTVYSVYAEKQEGQFAFRRGYDRWISNRRILLVEDVVTTGGSLSRVVKAVVRNGGTVAGAMVLCNRGNVTASQLGIERFGALVDLSLNSWAPEKCPLCRANVPINREIGRSSV